MHNKTDQSESQTRSNTPRSVMRIIQILDELSSRPTGASLTTLSVTIGTPKSSLLNLLRGLLEKNYLTFTNGLYQLGPEAYGMAAAIVSAQRFQGFADMARPSMRKLVDETHETAVLAVMSGDKKSAVYVEKIESPTAIRFSATVGDSRPLLWSAVGRVLLAFQPDYWLNNYLRTVKMVKHTPHSEVRRAQLKKILEEIRRTHVAVSIDQGTLGVSGFAAPIFDSSGVIVAAIGIAAPTERSNQRSAQLGKLVHNIGLEVSRLMGYRVVTVQARTVKRDVPFKKKP